MEFASNNLSSACGQFAGGMIANGSECIVVLKRSGEEVLKTDVVSTMPPGSPRDLVEEISHISGIPMEEIEIFVYVICGGARGRDI